jgi:hypothetical protein
MPSRTQSRMPKRPVFASAPGRPPREVTSAGAPNHSPSPELHPSPAARALDVISIGKELNLFWY